MKKLQLFGILAVGALLFIGSCKKDAIVTDSLYVPVASDATANATLAELQQGRTIYMNSCGSCHGLNSPDSYSASNWKSIVANMAPKAGLTAAQTTLVTKYVSRGN
jgi:mono/diheme cytochrome c family protein